MRMRSSPRILEGDLPGDDFLPGGKGAISVQATWMEKKTKYQDIFNTQAKQNGYVI